MSYEFESPLPPKEQSVHTRDLPDWAYLKAHETLAEDGEPCPYPEMVGRVGKALVASPPVVVPDELDQLLADLDGPSYETKQAALNLFKAAFGDDANLADACLGLRMACNGAADPIHPEELERGVAALRARLATWTPPHGPKWARLDAAFREMVEATLAEVAP